MLLLALITCLSQNYKKNLSGFLKIYLNEFISTSECSGLLFTLYSFYRKRIQPGEADLKNRIVVLRRCGVETNVWFKH